MSDDQLRIIIPNLGPLAALELRRTNRAFRDLVTSCMTDFAFCGPMQFGDGEVAACASFLNRLPMLKTIHMNRSKNNFHRMAALVAVVAAVPAVRCIRTDGTWFLGSDAVVMAQLRPGVCLRPAVSVVMSSFLSPGETGPAQVVARVAALASLLGGDDPDGLTACEVYVTERNAVDAVVVASALQAADGAPVRAGLAALMTAATSLTVLLLPGADAMAFALLGSGPKLGRRCRSLEFCCSVDYAWGARSDAEHGALAEAVFGAAPSLHSLTVSANSEGGVLPAPYRSALGSLPVCMRRLTMEFASMGGDDPAVDGAVLGAFGALPLAFRAERMEISECTMCCAVPFSVLSSPVVAAHARAGSLFVGFGSCSSAMLQRDRRDLLALSRLAGAVLGAGASRMQLVTACRSEDSRVAQDAALAGSLCASFASPGCLLRGVDIYVRDDRREEDADEGPIDDDNLFPITAELCASFGAGFKCEVTDSIWVESC